MTAHELVERVMRAILPGRYPTPEGCTEDLAVTKLLRHRIPLEKAAEALLADTRDWESAAHRLFNLLRLLDPNARNSWDATAIKTYESLNWKRRWQDAVKAMLKAADLLDDPVQGSDLLEFGKLLDMPTDDPRRLNVVPIPVDLGTVDSVVRYAELDLLALAVRRIANAMHEAGWEMSCPWVPVLVSTTSMACRPNSLEGGEGRRITKLQAAHFLSRSWTNGFRVVSKTAMA
jgi:hypothetical protein